MKLIKTDKKDKEDRKADNKRLYKMFFKRLLQDKGRVVAIMITMLLLSLLYASIPFVLKEGVQKLYLVQAYHYILFIAVGLIVANIVVGIIKEKLMVNYSLKFIADLKKDLFKGVLRKTINKFQHVGVGKFLAFISYNVSLVKTLVTQWGAAAIQQMLNFLALFIASFFIDTRLVVLFFAVFPIFIIYLLVIQYIVRNYALKLMTYNKQIFQNAYDTLDDFENVKMMAAEERKANSFDRVIDKDLKARIDRTLIYQYNKIILHGISLLLIIAFVAIGGQFLNQQEMSFSEFIFFVLYIHLLFRPFEIALLMSSYYEAGKIGIKTVFPFLTSKGYSKIENINLKGSIKIDNVTYKYPKGKFRLSKINLDVKAGEKMSIVGRSNAGKSTFVQMLLHARKLQKGDVYYDGKTAEEIGIRTLRTNISVVSKDYLLSTGTIFSFLSFGKKEKMVHFDDDLIILCQELGLNEKIIQMSSRKFQEKIYKNDIRLSESEKLKFALARAAYQDTSVLLLDNFWHNFDSTTKKQISDFINKYCASKTIIQFSSKADDLLIETDRMLELKDGKL